MIFKQDLELDAKLVMAAMESGISGYLTVCFMRRDLFPDTKTAMARARWFKRQPKTYLNSVTARIVEIENASFKNKYKKKRVA